MTNTIRGGRTELLRRAMVLLPVALLACGGSGGDLNTLNTAGFSGPVNIRLDKFKDGDVHDNTFDDNKDVNTQSGNPYAEFLRQATNSLGRAPAAVLVDRVTFAIGPNSRGVTGFEQIFTGNATVYLSTSSTTVPIGTAAMPSGPGPVSVQITAGRTELAPMQADLVSGRFKVGFRVAASPSRPSSFDTNLAVVLYFRALAQ